MSITNELRGWAAAWWRAHLSEDGTITICTIETDEPTQTVKNIIIAMADRIDAMHEHEMTMARGEAIQYLESLKASDQYIKPVDADGVPISIGDTMEWPDGSTAEVIGIGDGVFFYKDDESDGADWSSAENKHHVKPDSWEQIIKDAKNQADAAARGQTLIDSFRFTDEQLIERCRRLAHEDE